jgi:hypothetical protein
MRVFTSLLFVAMVPFSSFGEAETSRLAAFGTNMKADGSMQDARRTSTTEPGRSLYSSGISLGYLLPANGKFAYVRETGSILMPSEEEKAYSRILQIAMLNTWQFDDLLLRTDLSVGILPDRFIFGGEASLNYLFGHAKVSPFLGGGAGIYHGPVDDDSQGDMMRNISPAVNFQGGLLFFRGYDVNLVLRGKYLTVFNSDGDHGFVVDVGFTYALPNLPGTER